MRNNLQSVHTKPFMALGEDRECYLSRATNPYPVWTARHPKPEMAHGYRRTGKDTYSFYTLPNGAKATLEQIVLFVPLENLFRHGYEEFSIADIRFDAFYRFRLELSWKQVRDALYRLNHGKLLFRHIAKGVYTWNMKQ